MSDLNPLLDFSGLPRFERFQPEHVSPALDILLAEARDTVAALTRPGTPATWEGFVVPIENATERLSRAWSLVGHLCSVADTPPLRAAFNQNLPRVTQFWTELGQNRALYQQYQALRESSGYAALGPARQRAVDLALQGFRLGGVELVSPARERYLALSERHA
ncbi:MAG: oligopeptidase A, partial [Betaproteobacteria bacterium]|nr:oligopeptidase A [Betaproteobacteria bacterium]